MSQINIQYYSTNFGELIIGSFEDRLCLCDWRYRKMRETIDRRIQTGLSSYYSESSSDIIKLTILQLEEYFDRERTLFDIPLLFVGSEFQKNVWTALLQVPYGTTESYAELSNGLNNPDAIRAVSTANGANAISIIVPCHRIIGSDGKLVGYAGGLQAKQNLLKLESNSINSQLELFE